MRAWWRSLVCLTGLLLAAGPVLAEGTLAEVRDEANLFNPDVVREVNAKLHEIHRIYHRDVLIETIKQIPKDVLERLEKDKKPVQAFTRWARELAQQNGVQGIFVLISADPRPGLKHAAVLVWPESEEKILLPRYCDEIRRAFVNGMKNNSPNQALDNMVEKIRDRLRSSLADETTAVLPISWTTIGLIVLGVMVLWLVASVVRMRTPHPDPAAAGEGSGKHLPGVMGGMFGGMASHWIYDKAIHHDVPPDGVPPGSPPAGGPATPSTGVTPAATPPVPDPTKPGTPP